MIVLAVVAGAGAWVLTQAWHVREELSAVPALGDDLVSAVGSGDTAAARTALAGIAERTGAASDAADGPLWRAFEAVPWVGAQLSALRTVADESAAVSAGGVDPLLDAADGMGAGLDPAALADAQEPLAAAAQVWAQADAAVEAVDVGALLPQLADGVARVRDVLHSGASAVDGLARAAAVLPGMLGEESPRDILVMLQNPAEARTGGGITGAFVELRADRGSISLVRQADSSLFPWRSSPVADVPQTTTALYGDVVGRYVQNATMTSDFSVSAQLASAWWQSAYGTTPDAVIAIDPLVLRALLSVHGPVALADGSTLSSDDVVDRLLVQPYLTLAPAEQTAYLEQVTSSVFGALTSDIRPIEWVKALAPAVAEGRVSLWSADPAEQAAIDGSAVGGMAERVDAAGDAGFGLYLNDATGGKMDSYLSVGVASGFASCADADGTTAIVRVTLTSTAPADATGWPESMTGGGLFGTAIGDIGTLVTVSAPPGAAFGGVTGEKGAELSANSVDGARPSTAVRVNVSPGESETVEFRFVLPSRPASDPTIVHTPWLSEITQSTLTEGDACT
ncbi:DUF4012 domain-containing protein [Microbacterium sp. NPDC091313]